MSGGEISSQHILYIPLILLVGLVLGYILGLRAARAEQAREKERLKE